MSGPIGLMVIECMDCSRTIRREILRREYPEFLVSHGLCRRCAFWRRWGSALTAASVIGLVVLWGLAVRELLGVWG
ncbi:MAG: hypothetical protein ACE5FG_16100 [Myxococcota bacterium]